MNEELAEYTGVMLGRVRDSIKQHLSEVITHAANHKSLIRSFPYITGPVYGYLLFDKNPEWTLKIDSSSNFSNLIESNYHVNLPDKHLDQDVSAHINQYNGKAIISSEKLKEQEHQKLFSDYIVRFTKQPVLTVQLIKIGISFNPNNLFDLGEHGTVYPTAEIKDSWGQLTVSEDGVLMKDWRKITLSAGEGISNNGRVIEGKGWKITLNSDWEIIKNDSLHFGLVKKE